MTHNPFKTLKEFNCRLVDYGVFGNLKVFSHPTWASMVQDIDVCKADKEVNSESPF